jgi:hypothetical protein
MITDATILNADIGASAAIAQSKLAALASTNMPAGSTVQVVNVMNGAVATGTTVIPHDDTIPQKTEGIEFMTLAITPTHASNKLVIQWTANIATNGAKQMLTALFQDTTANALAVLLEYNSNTNAGVVMSGTHYMAAGTTSATTFKLRCGPQAASTMTFNGYSAGRLYGGVMASSMTITEIKV